MTIRAIAANASLLGSFHQNSREKEAAVNLLQKTIATTQSAPDSRDRADLQLLLGRILVELGAQGQSGRFEQAIKAYQAALDAFPRDREPLTWAAIQYEVAGLYFQTSMRNPAKQGLNDAVKILNEVLSIWTRDTSPIEWAKAQVRLGEILTKLGQLDPSRQYKEQAVTAEKSALEVLTPDKDPFGWSYAQNLLGSNLADLAEREGSTDRLLEAVTALRAGTTQELRERAPPAWTQAQLSLATTLQILGLMEWQQASSSGDDAERLWQQAQEHFEESVAASRAGIDEAIEARNPGLLAYLRSRLGRTLQYIGEMEADENDSEATVHLNESVKQCRASLEILTPQNDRDTWADTESTLADALETLGNRDSSREDFEAAIEVLKKVEPARSQESDPASWVATQNSLGLAYEKLGKLEKGEVGLKHLEEAIMHLQAALKLESPDHNFQEWLETQQNLAAAETEAGRLEPGTEHLQQAARAYREELKYLAPNSTLWKMATDGLNAVQNQLRARGEAG